MSKTLQRRLRFVRLPTPILEKGVLPFSLPLIESIERSRLGLPSLEFRQLIEQTTKKFPLVVEVLTVLVFLDLLPLGQDRCHWIIFVRIRIRVSKFDVNDGVDLTIP